MYCHHFNDQARHIHLVCVKGDISPLTTHVATGGTSKRLGTLSDPSFPYLGSYPCVILTTIAAASISLTIEPVIWAGLGEGGLICEDLLWDEVLSHMPGKLVQAVSQAGSESQWLLGSFLLTLEYVDFLMT